MINFAMLLGKSEYLKRKINSVKLWALPDLSIAQHGANTGVHVS